MRQLKKNNLRFLAMFLAFVMTFTSIPTQVFATIRDDNTVTLNAQEAVKGTPVTVTDNVIDIEDNKFATLSKYHATVNTLTISGAEVTNATQDGANIYIELSSATTPNAQITANFNCATDKFTVDQSANNVTLENGTGELSVKLTGKYSNRERGNCTYNLHFSCEAVPTEVPTRKIETDSKEVYSGSALQLDLRDYFSKATEYYLLEKDKLTKLDSSNYTFESTKVGTYSLVFAASNIVGNCPDYVTVTVTVKGITSGIYINHQTSNGSFNYVTFTDSNGNEIEGIECNKSGTTIDVILPKTYDINGKVKATFNLTQNDSQLPFITTSNSAAGASSASKKRTSEITSTLSEGEATATVYFYDIVPKATNNKYETYIIKYAVKNQSPALADGQDASATAVITAGETYKLDLTKLFKDEDGDKLTYSVSVNGEKAVAADAQYSFTTDTAGEYKLVFTAHDGKSSSTDTYTVTLTVENVKDTYSMTINVPEDLSPEFYTTNGYTDGVDILGDKVKVQTKDTKDGLTSYIVEYPQNAKDISVRTNEWGGMAISTEKDGTATLTKVKFDTVDFANNALDATISVKYGDYTAVSGTEGYLLVAGKKYSCAATPSDTDTYVAQTQECTAEAKSEIQIVTLAMNFKSPKTITVPTGAKAQLFAYNKYYDFTEIEAKAVVNNENGTTTYYFITNKNNLSYRASMDGKVTEAGYWTNNVTVNFDDGKNSPKDNAEIEDNSVLVNVNRQNHLKLKVGDSYKLKGYRAWEIIKYSYQNEIITPNFNFNILSGSDVVSLSPANSISNGGSGEDSDWMTVKALKKGTAIIEVTYDAIDVVGGSWPGLYKASDADRSGLIVVTVGGADESVDFGIDSYASQGALTYKKENAKKWDSEFDTLYFIGDSGELKLSPTANSKIKEVAVSNDKGSTWTTLSKIDGSYTARIVEGNNIIRVTTESGTAYQVVRGGKITTTVTEVMDSSDGDGLIEAGEKVRIILDGLHTPIPKMAGNYNPGYKANTEGDSSVHMVYKFQDETVSGTGVQYTFSVKGNSIEVTIPKEYKEDTISLTDGYISVGVIGLKSFADGGDSHRNIPDSGCTTRGNETTFHTRSILPEISLRIGEAATENTAPTVKDGAVTEASITLGQNYAINPETLFTDKDGNKLTYKVAINDGEASDITSAYKFTPDEVGTYKLTFTASDGKEEVSHIITLTVKKAENSDNHDLKFDISDDEIDGYVTVSFEDNGIRENGITGLKYPVALGMIIEPIKVPYKKGDSIAAVTIRLLDALDIDYTYSGTVESGFYLAAIKNFVVNNTPYDEMGEFHAGSGSGWMITQNGVFIDRGASDFTVKEGDILRWQYTCQLGADIGDNYQSEQIHNVESLIDAIGTVTKDSEKDIKAARQAYDALNELQKKAVKNYDKLVAAEKAFAQLSSTNKDKNAADKVEALISAIGKVTLASEGKIKEARKAYDALTDIQKQLVENYNELVKAENILNNLKNPSHAKVYKETGEYIAGLGTPLVGSIGGDWMALGLARSDREVPKGYFNNVVSYVKENINENGQLHWYKSTENSRVILGLTAAGYDPTNVAGYNLLTALSDMAYVKKQGINGPIWALIAFDSHDYEIPKGGDVTREALIKTILAEQLKDGGWALSGTISDPDMTGMAIQALAPYYYKNSDVKKVVDKALKYLSDVQNEDGSYTSTDGANAESIAQVIVALTALGINPELDARFIKNGISVVDALCNYAVNGGGFKHTVNGRLDGMATEQGYYALTAYMRFLEGKTSLYDMSDVTIKVGNSTDKGESTNKEESTDKEESNNKEDSTNKEESKDKIDSTNQTTSNTTGTNKPHVNKQTDAENVDKMLESITDDSKVKELIDVIVAYEKLTDKEKAGINKKAIEELKERVSYLIKTDSKTGISISGADWNIGLAADEVLDKEKIITLEEKLNGNSILAAWDLYPKDILTGEKYKLSESITVKIPLKLLGDYSAYDGIAVVHYNDDGTAEYLNYDIVGDYIVFDSVEFSYYAVVGYNGASPMESLTIGDTMKTEATGISWHLWAIAGSCGVLLLVALFVLLKIKNKSHVE